MKHQILFSDIDGTLLNEDRELSPLTIAEISRIKETIPVVLISSRMPSAMTHLQDSLQIGHMPLICYNGGLILIDKKIVYSSYIDLDSTASLMNFNKDQKFHISLYHENDWYVPDLDFWAQREIRNTKVVPKIMSGNDVVDAWKADNKGAHKIMCMGEERYIDHAFSFLKKNFNDQLHLYRSKPTYIEIANKNVSKLTAINWLLSYHYHIPIENVVAFGDNYNDITMLEGVGTGVAVANAKPEVLKIADAITLAGKEDGVAAYLKNHF